MRLPESLAPAARLTSDSAASPHCAATAITSPSSAPQAGKTPPRTPNSAAATIIAAIVPPITPVQLLLGEICGKGRPRGYERPLRYANVSHAQTVRTRQSNHVRPASRTPEAGDEPGSGGAIDISSGTNASWATQSAPNVLPTHAKNASRRSDLRKDTTAAIPSTSAAKPIDAASVRPASVARTASAGSRIVRPGSAGRPARRTRFAVSAPASAASAATPSVSHG